jgi:Ca2+-binding RTX toxin-like protein
MAYAAPAFVDFKANLSLPVISSALDVTPLANGGFAVIGNRNGHINGGIYNSSGAVVRTFKDVPGIDGAVAQLADGNLVIASISAGKLSFTVIDPITGITALPTTPVAVPAGRAADVTALKTGGFAVSYEFRFGPTDTDLYIDTYSNTGLRQTTITVDSSFDDNRDMTVATLDNGNIAAAWTQLDNDTGNTKVFYAVYAPDGTSVVPPTQAITSDLNINRNPAISAADGGFAIAFETRRQPAAPTTVDIVVKTYSLTGVQKTSSFITNTLLQFGFEDESNDSNPFIQRAPDGNLIVSYMTENFGTEFDVIKDGVSNASTVLGGSGGVVTFFGIGQVAAFSFDGGALKGQHLFGNRDGSGNNANDRASGDDFFDIMNGGGGNDTLSGGRNNDEVKGDNGNDLLHGNEGDDTVNGGGDTGNDAGADTLFGDEGNDLLLGAGGNDTLNGGDGNDTLNGESGADLMRGGTGNDTYHVDNAGDVVDEQTGGGTGTDTVIATITVHLGDPQFLGEVENATAAEGAGNLELVGNGLANVLKGNSGANQINGSDGADTMMGGAGDDFYFVDSAGDVVDEAAGGGAGTDTIRSTVNINLTDGAHYKGTIEHVVLDGAGLKAIGTGAADHFFTANAGNQTLDGRGGNDTLDGGAGNDTMIGGAGDDLYFVDNSGDRTVEDTAGAAGGVDTVISSVGRTLGANLENLQLAGTAHKGIGNDLANIIMGNTALANELQGLAGNDTLTGGEGNDTLKGGSGVDSMIGGLGNDIYYADDANDIAEETTAGAAGGTDTVFSTAASYTLGANVEILRLQGAGDLAGTGNGLNNRIFGNGGANLIQGLAGADRLEGGNGGDTLAGGQDNDTMSGGSGADLFRFAAANTGVDTITDFNKNGDRFDLSGGLFTAVSIAPNGDAVLTHTGGAIRIQNPPPSLTLGQWNALVVPAGPKGGAPMSLAAIPDDSTDSAGIVVRHQSDFMLLGHGDYIHL